jgi:uncharacterized membrane protein
MFDFTRLFLCNGFVFRIVKERFDVCVGVILGNAEDQCEQVLACDFFLFLSVLFCYVGTWPSSATCGVKALRCCVTVPSLYR